MSKVDESQAFLENVRTLAKDQGKSLRKIEEACGLSYGYLTRAPRTGKGITLQTAVALSKELNTPLNVLILRKADIKSINEGLVMIDTQIASLHLERARLLEEIGT